MPYLSSLTLNEFTTLTLDEFTPLLLEPLVSYDDFYMASTHFNGANGSKVANGGICYNSLEDIELGKKYIYSHTSTTLVNTFNLNEQYSGLFRVR